MSRFARWNGVVSDLIDFPRAELPWNSVALHPGWAAAGVLVVDATAACTPDLGHGYELSGAEPHAVRHARSITDFPYLRVEAEEDTARTARPIAIVGVRRRRCATYDRRRKRRNNKCKLPRSPREQILESIRCHTPLRCTSETVSVTLSHVGASIHPPGREAIRALGNSS